VPTARFDPWFAELLAHERHDCGHAVEEVDDSPLASEEEVVVDIIRAADSDFVSNAKIIETIAGNIWRSDPYKDIEVDVAVPAVVYEDIHKYVVSLLSHQGRKSAARDCEGWHKAVCEL
jgi:hypothetical protein